MRAAVLGAGSWGTAFAKVLTDAGTDTVLWARRPELAEAINAKHENPDYLSGLILPPGLVATADPAEALAGVDLVAIAIPSQTLRDNLGRWVPLLPPEVSLVSLMKGIELGTVKRMSEVIGEVAGAEPDRVAVVSGPNLAREIAAEQPTATVVACVDPDRAAAIQDACTAPYFRPYTNTDVVGTELGGAVKNVIALACGMAVGMGYGDNTTASLITRGLAETSRLGMALGADPTKPGKRSIPSAISIAKQKTADDSLLKLLVTKGKTLKRQREKADGSSKEKETKGKGRKRQRTKQVKEKPQRKKKGK